MANPEHLKILQKGVDEWNEWRLRNGVTRPDLSGVDLSGANLSRTNLGRTNLSDTKLRGAGLVAANFYEADLSRAKLNGADLSKAGLSNAHIPWADLSEANLSEADLGGTELMGCNFTEANFSEANLGYANLNNAKLYGAQFHNATFNCTVLTNMDLRRTIGLESVRHNGPSSIGLDTFFLSAGKISAIFLRGAGVPDIFIDYASSLAGESIEFYSAFISYSSRDEDLAKRLYADLQAKGVRCWFAPEDLKIGDKFRTEIDRAIRVHDKLMLLLSANSILSDWVEKEVETAFERERREKRIMLFPIRLDDTIMDAVDGWAADIRRSRNIGDFSKWKNHDSYEKAFNRLLRDLKAKP